MERIGATDLNGTTSEDRTNYFENVPTSALDYALFAESDRMGHCSTPSARRSWTCSAASCRTKSGRAKISRTRIVEELIVKDHLSGRPSLFAHRDRLDGGSGFGIARGCRSGSRPITRRRMRCW